MPGRIEFEVGLRGAGAAPRRSGDSAGLRLLLCGDFGGRASRGLDDPASLAGRRPQMVDVDSLEGVMARLAPACVDPSTGETLHLAAPDDFHPDTLFQRADGFTRLRALRAALGNPAEFERARAALVPAAAGESDAAAVQRLLGRSPAAPPPAPAPGIEAWLQDLVRPHIRPGVGVEQAELMRAVDSTIAEQMRRLLHGPSFQALESAWRAVEFLVSRLDLDGTVRLQLFDLTRAELDVAAAEPDLQRGGLWRALAAEAGAPAGAPAGASSMLVSLEAFGPGTADLAALSTLATVAAARGGPVMATASARLVGHPSWAAFAEAGDVRPEPVDAARWQALRRSALAPWIGLAAPGWLLRRPYGARSDPVERFGFDEMAGAEPAQALLWGPAGVAVAALAGLDTLNDDGVLELDDLPAWVHEVDGERRLYPVAQCAIGEQAALAALAHGVMPLIGWRDRPAMRLLRRQSIADPPTAI